jgi:hypothetical protein
MCTALCISQQVAAQVDRNSPIANANIGPVIGTPFTISWDSINEISPAVAYNSVDREYLVVWQNGRAVNDDIYAQRISEQGNLLSWFSVAEGESPDVAYNPKNNTYLVVFQKWVGSDYDIYAQRVDFTGPLGSPFFVANNLNDTEHDPAVAYNTHPHHDEFLVVWENGISNPVTVDKIEGIRLAGTTGEGDGGYETIGGRIDITDINNYNRDPDVAYNLNMNEYLVVYTYEPGSGGPYDVYGRRVTWNGSPLTEEVIDSSANNQFNPTVAAYRLNQDTPYLVVFTDFWNDTAGDVRGYLVDKDGKPNTLINIATVQGQREFNPAIAHNEAWEGYLVSWTQGPINDHDVLGMQVRNDGFYWPAFDISGTSGDLFACNRNDPDIAMGNASALAVWSDPCGSAGGIDILGRILGYQINLPLTLR